MCFSEYAANVFEAMLVNSVVERNIVNTSISCCTINNEGEVFQQLQILYLQVKSLIASFLSFFKGFSDLFSDVVLILSHHRYSFLQISLTGCVKNPECHNQSEWRIFRGGFLNNNVKMMSPYLRSLAKEAKKMSITVKRSSLFITRRSKPVMGNLIIVSII